MNSAIGAAFGGLVAVILLLLFSASTFYMVSSVISFCRLIGQSVVAVQHWAGAANLARHLGRLRGRARPRCLRVAPDCRSPNVLCVVQKLASEAPGRLEAHALMPLLTTG